MSAEVCYLALSPPQLKPPLLSCTGKGHPNSKRNQLLSTSPTHLRESG